MRRLIISFACALVWTASAPGQEFKAVLTSNDFRPGKEITLTIQGGSPPFTFLFGSGFFRGERLLLDVKRVDERTYRINVLEELGATDSRTITVEDEAGRETIAQAAPCRLHLNPTMACWPSLSATCKAPTRLYAFPPPRS